MERDATVLLSHHKLDDHGAVMALVTLNRPEQMNPIDHPTVVLLRERMAEALRNPAVRMVAFTGAGTAFSAGGDMKKYIQLQSDPVAFPQFLDDLHGFFDSLAACPVPTVALVNGVAIAGGIELILACDVAIASARGRIGDAHLPFGQMGGGGVLSRLPRQVGRQKARELIFSGRILPAQEALEWGLVNGVVPADELLAAAIEFGRDVAKKSPLAVANVKKVMNRIEVEGLGRDAALEYERAVTADYCLNSTDAREGLEAFSAKRRPVFQGV